MLHISHAVTCHPAAVPPLCRGHLPNHVTLTKQDMLLGCMAPRPCRKLRLCALLLLLLSELALQHAAARQEEEGEGEK